MKIETSIIIPTYNRANILEKCLEALEKQTYKNFEIIIVDDGSEDNTKKTVYEFKKKSKLKISYICQEHKQQGAARNKGVKKAGGKYVVFTGDDIITSENWLSEHIRTQKKNNNTAVLGLTLWHPELKINDFMRHLAPNGPQFNYGLIKNKEADWRFFWTSNISLERKWLDKEKFDENFCGWGYEDLELGYRLEKRGLRIVFNDKAIAYHYHHYYNPEEFLRKYENVAKSVLYFVKKHPELKQELIEKNKLRKWQNIMLWIYALNPMLKKIKKFDEIYWKLRRRYYFSRGVSGVYKSLKV